MDLEDGFACDPDVVHVSGDAGDLDLQETAGALIADLSDVAGDDLAIEGVLGREVEELLLHHRRFLSFRSSWRAFFLTHSRQSGTLAFALLSPQPRQGFGMCGPPTG